jgi:hypothetical protein
MGSSNKALQPRGKNPHPWVQRTLHIGLHV